MASRQGFHDEALAASMTLRADRATAAQAQADPPGGVEVVILPVSIEIPLTPELRKRLARR